MIPKSKTNPTLGLEVREHLIKKGVETPMAPSDGMDSDQKKAGIKRCFTDIMEFLGLDLTDDSLCDTPERVSKMFIDEIYYGLNYDNFPKCTAVDNKMKYKAMLIEKNITCMSSCEHHFVTIDGFCHVAYIPGKKVIGLSKINRIVDFFAKRPQIQERLTEQIYHALSFILETEDVAVIIDASHYCVKSRGIRDTTSSTVTSKVGGKFEENSDCRAELLTLIKQ